MNAFNDLTPTDPSHWYRLGIRMQEQGQLDQAVQAYRTALVADPANPDILNNLGNSCASLNRFGEAQALLERTFWLIPESAAALYNLGVAFYRQGRLDEAVEAYEAALERDPAFPEALTNLGSAFVEMNRLPEAVSRHRMAIVLRPDFTKAYNNLAVATECSGIAERALDAYRRALQIDTAYPTARYNMSHVQLLLGDYAAGWQNYRWRWKGGDPAQLERPFAVPRWEGEPLAGRTLLLHGEQGLGDVLQFARYAPLIAAQGGRVVFEVYPPLVRLLKSLSGVADVIARGTPLPPVDLHLALLDAPAIFRTSLTTVPTDVPYLAADTQRAADWQAKLSRENQGRAGKKVGLVWAGDPRPHDRRAHAADQRRSLHLSQFDDILGLPGVSFVSLQMGAAAGQIAQLGWQHRLGDPMPGVEDFADTAALIATLDLVITVDTAVAHAAGALGKPVWILSRFDGCWRWLQGRDDTPWYPTAKLFRQTAPGQWDAVILRLAAELADWTGVGPDPLFDSLRQGYGAGRIERAVSGYRAILERHPHHAACLHHLGLHLHQSGKPGDALAYLRHDAILRPEAAAAYNAVGAALRASGQALAALVSLRHALTIRPDFPDAWNNLGIALQNSGCAEEAATQFAMAIQLQPDHVEALNNLGNLHQQQGRLPAALALYRRALVWKPDYAAALHHTGIALQASGAREDAARHFSRAATVLPTYAEAHNNFAAACNELGRPDEAEAAARRAWNIRPDYAEALSNLAAALNDLGRPTEASVAAQQSLFLKESSAPAHNNLGNALRSLGLFEDAVACYRRAIALDPTFAPAYNNLAVVCQQHRMDRPAIALYRQAVVLRPAYREPHINLATAFLSIGQYEAGWQEFEWRLGGKQRVPTLVRPKWTGEALDGKTILLLDEQGHGDVLQFARYIKMVADRGGRVLLRAHPVLRDLLARLPGVAQVVADDTAADFDVYASLLSLPHILECGGATLPDQIPYVRADERKAAVWAERLAGLSGLKVGLVWAGDPRRHDPIANAIDHRRSIALFRFAALLKTAGVSFVSLQLGEAARQIAEIPAAFRPVDPTSGIADFEDSAAIVANLDLIITVDTAMAHLAGAMGKPVWILSRFDGCWRWLRDRDDSPWYPTARLFRQDLPGNWVPVIERVAAALAETVGRASMSAKNVEPDKAARPTEELEQLFAAALPHHQAGRLAEARDLYHAILCLRPHQPTVLNHLGALEQQAGHLDGALALLRRAVRVSPHAAESWSNFGIALNDSGQFAEAQRAFHNALLLAPGLAEIHANLARVAKISGDLTTALHLFQRAIFNNPDHPEIHSNYGAALLTAGDFAAGWREHEWRLKPGGARGLTHRQFREPAWNGDDPKGRTILLHAEQGLGDTLQFVRYAPLLVERGAKVILEVYRPLTRLLACLPGVDTVVATGDTLPPFDAHLSLMSAPFAMKTTLETVPAHIPYLAADATAVAAWHEKISPSGRLKVGLVWAGDPRPHDPSAHKTDKARSIPLRTLMPLLRETRVQFISLQQGAARTQLQDIPASHRPLDPMDAVDDFADTAALVETLDLIITVDTAVAHLAGGLGKPVWILSRFDGCWRWLKDHDDTPWYPTARLFHQHAPGAWDDVIARVGEVLAGILAERRYLAHVADQPGDAWGWRCLGLLAGRAQHAVRELRAFEHAVRLDPGNAEGLNNLGIVYNESGNNPAATQLYRQALIQHPSYAKAYNGLGKCLADVDQPILAISSYRRALALEPDFSLAENNLGAALLETGHVGMTAALYKKLLSNTPALPLAQSNLAVILLAEGRWADAATASRRALALDPHAAEPHVSLAMAQLAQGHFAEGWAEYEWRFKGGAKHWTQPAYSAPLWQGQALRGRSIVLYGEQGYGDVLQFARFAGTLAEQGAQVTLHVAAPLVRLLATLPGETKVVSLEEPSPPSDYYLPLLSLPHRLRVTLETLPASTPYLAADPEKAAAIARRLERFKDLRVGLVWAGGGRADLPMAAAIDQRRSIPLAAFRPLLTVPGVRFISLQTDAAALQLGDLPAELRPLDLMADVNDFADTAALMASLDLLISVDTAVVHLAGAMGLPVWILSRHGGCWRWLENRDDTPWYPCARLFRQETAGNWEPVIEQVRRALEQDAIR